MGARMELQRRRRGSCPYGGISTTRLSNNRGNPQVESTDAIAANAIACDYVDIVRLETGSFALTALCPVWIGGNCP